MAKGNQRTFRRLAVVGAGNMGSGIAQKMATEGFSVTLVDLDEEKAARGVALIEATLAEGVKRKIFRDEQAAEIRERVRGTSDWSRLGDADLVVEAVFEDPAVKREVFRRLDDVCRQQTVLATNTSSLSVTELADATRHPERVIGLHYFYHPAKNRLVEVIPGKRTDPDLLRSAWTLQEELGKTPIASADVFGFVVNRYFVPWLNESVRLLEENVADIPTIEAACKESFGVGMGPFELMNVTGIPIALHSATTLGAHLGPFYAPAETLRRQVDSGKSWIIEGEADRTRFAAVADRMQATTYFVAASLVDEGVGSIEDTDIGARVGLRWPRGPFQMMNRVGMESVGRLVGDVTRRWNLEQPALLGRHVSSGKPFTFRLVHRSTADGIATLTINRPDAMNALNESVVEQLKQTFREAVEDPGVRAIVLAGAGKAFVAGADIRFFVRNIDAGDLDRIVRFTKEGQDLLLAIDRCPKPVIARLHGLTLGGGLELALACDRIVATPRASMAFPETGIGIYPGLGGTQRTPRRIGSGLAKWLIYTGQMLGAEQARQIGLVDRVVPHSELDAEIHEMVADGIDGPPERPQSEPSELDRFFGSHTVEAIRSGATDAPDDAALAKAAKKVAGKAPVALRLSEKLIDGGIRGPLEAGLKMELDHLTEIFGTEDAYEGLSTLGKRRPQFKGR